MVYKVCENFFSFKLQNPLFNFPSLSLLPKGADGISSSSVLMMRTSKWRSGINASSWSILIGFVGIARRKQNARLAPNLHKRLPPLSLKRFFFVSRNTDGTHQLKAPVKIWSCFSRGKIWSDRFFEGFVLKQKCLNFNGVNFVDF